MKTRCPVLLSATLLVFGLLGGARVAHAQVFSNNTAGSGSLLWSGGNWTGNFTNGESPGPVTNRETTIIRLTGAPSGRISTNDYPTVVLNQLIRAANNPISLYGTGTLIFTNNGATMPAVSNSSDSIFTINEGLNATTTIMFRAISSGGIVVNSNITGLGSLVVSNTGAGALTLGGNNSYSGGTLLAAGVAVISNDNAFGTGLLTMGGGVISNAAGNNYTVGNAINLAQTMNLIVGSTDVLTLNGAITNTGSLIKSGAGTLVLGGVNSYSGNTTNSAGVLALGTNNALGSGTLVLANGVTLASDSVNARMATNSVVFSGSAGAINFGTPALTGDLTLGAAGSVVDFGGLARTLNVTNAGTTVTLLGSFTNATAEFTKGGAGTLALKGADVISNNNVYITGGTLWLGDGGTLTVTSTNANSAFYVAQSASSALTGTVVVADGGSLYLTNRLGTTSQGLIGFGYANGVTPFGNLGTLIVSNGGVVRMSSQSSTLFVLGRGPGGYGRLLMSGGSVDVNMNLSLGAYNNGSGSATGEVQLTGGILTATNMVAGGWNVKIGDGNVGIMVISNTGVFLSDRVIVGNSNTVAGQGLMVITKGGVFEMTGTNSLTVANGSGASGVISNVNGGTIQFTVNSPLISTGALGAVYVANSTIGFRGVNAASFDSTNMQKFTYQGANTLRLDAATNASRASYTFATNLNPNYAYLDLANGAAFQATNLTIGLGGKISGTGTILANMVTNQGTLAPGHSPGTLTFSSNLTLLNDSLLVLELQGTNAADYDHLVVKGTLTRGGAILVTNLGWAFAKGDTFDFWDAAAVNGSFLPTNTWVLPALDGGLFWDTSLFESEGILSVAAIPEPSVLTAVVASLGVMLLLRRRKV